MCSIVCVTDHQGKLYVGNYELIARLGRGGFGQVMLARKRSTDGSNLNKDVVALKVVPKSRVSVVEKEVLIRAVGHPFLVQLLSYFETKVHHSCKQFMSIH
jgi:serine/threonine protein kinase